MTKGAVSTQESVNDVWSRVWDDESESAPQKLFSHRLFIEGYAVYEKYLPSQPFRFLEIGTGSGRYGAAFAREYSESTFVLSDTVSSSLQVTQKLLDALSLTNVSLQKEDACSFTFPDESFDVVFADVVIQHIPDYEKAVQEMVRILRPGGRIIVSAVNSKNPPHRLYKWILRLRGKEYEYGYERTFTRAELRELLLGSGLSVEAEDGFYLAYGMYRWGYTRPVFKLLARMLNRLITILDSVTGRYISRRWGFEIVCVGMKS